MTAPVRFKDSEGTNPWARELLKSAPRTSTMPLANRALGARRVADLARGSVVGVGLAVLFKGTAAAFAIGAAAAVGVVAAVPPVRDAIRSHEKAPAIRPSSPPRDSTVLPQAPSAPGPPGPPGQPIAGSGSREPPARGFSDGQGSTRMPRALPEGRPSPTAEPIRRPTAVQGREERDHPVEPDFQARTPRPPASAGMSNEVLILLEARRRTVHDPAGALALLQEHAGEFAAGTLGMEREVLIIDVLERLGRNAEAAKKARALLDASPDALYVERLRQIVRRADHVP